MHISYTNAFLLLLAASAHAADNAAAAEYPPAPKTTSSTSTKVVTSSKPAAKFAHAVATSDPAPAIGKAQETLVAAVAGPGAQPGTVDAPVDGLDGKPHDGPGLFETAGKGTGDVGISGGNPHVDISNPPPHTGDHEIVDVEENDEKKDDAQKTKKPVAKEDDSDDEGDEDELSSGPVSSSEHKEYSLGGTDTQKDPPVIPPAHLTTADATTEASSISAPLHSFVLSFIMIIFSEIGDKTFLVAALMAMKHPRFLVFSAAFSALIAMSILSAVLGHAVPTLIPKKFTNFLAAGLFLVFGVRMILEGLRMEKGTGNVQDEMRDVEKDIEEKTAGRGRGASISRKLESGLAPGARHGTSGIHRSTSSPSLSDEDEDDYARARGGGKGSGKAGMTFTEGVANLAGLLLSPAWVQTFVMTFLGEWGDRSQIATIAMAAGQDYWYVTVGAITGHGICTGIAVIGGRMLASRISVRNVTLGGAAAFLLFGIIYLGEALYV